MSLKRALVVLFLIAAAVTAVVLLNSDAEPDPTGLGDDEARSEAAETGGAADTQKGNSAEGAAGRTGERRETVAGTGDTPRGDGLVPLRGRLVFADGTPAVAKLVFRENRFEPGAVVRGDLTSRTGGADAEVATDAEGRFLIRTQPGKVGTLRVEGQDVVMAKANAGMGVHVRIGVEGTDLGDVLVARAATIVGQVVSGSGGVEGVEIVYGSSPAPAISGLFTDLRTKTDAEGRFTIRGLVPGKIRMDTRSPEFLPAHHEVAVAEGQRKSDVLIKLVQGGVITGTVVDDRGQPVEGATVSAARSRKLAEGVEYSGFAAGESTTTDASGHFRLAGLAESSVELRASKTGFEPGREPAAKAGQSNVVLELKRLGTVSGILVDEKGNGIAGSDIAVRPGGGDGLRVFGRRSATKTDGKGRFVVEGVIPGRSTVVASGDTHLEAREDVAVRPGETTKDVRLTARRGSTLTVTVLDEKGAPVVGANVIASTPGSSGTGSWTGGGGRRYRNRTVMRDRRDGHTETRILGEGEELGSAKTDENGVAVLRGMPAGEAKITAKHEELALLEPGKTEIPDAGEVETKLTMQRGGFVEVNVVDTRGRALGQKSLTVIGPLRSAEDEPGREPHKADPEGEVTIGPLAPGSYKAALAQDAVVRSMGPGMSFSLAGDERDLEDSVVPFVIKAGDTTKIELVMPVLTTVKGTVRDAEGPVEAAEVEMVAEGEIRMPMLGKYKSRTDGSGAFEIKGLPSGKYTLHYSRKGAIVPAEKEVVLVRNQAELTEDLVLPGAVVKLRVKDGAEGFGVEEAEISLRKYQPPQPGSAAQARPRRVMMIGMSVDSGSGGGPSTFRMSSGAAKIETDANGRAEIPGVPPGKYTLTIEHVEYAKTRKVVQVVGDQLKDLGDIPVHAGCKVRGKVEFAGKPGPLNLATVEISDDSGFAETTISRDGSFRFTGLKAGQYKVRAQAIGTTEWGEAKTIQANPDSPARVTVVVPKS